MKVLELQESEDKDTVRPTVAGVGNREGAHPSPEARRIID